MKILFRTDSSRKIGTGHVMRCLNFANMLKAVGHGVKFVCRNLEYNISSKIQDNGFEVFSLEKDILNRFNDTNVIHHSWLETSWENDAKETIKIFDNYNADLLIIDHYAIDYKWEEEIKKAANCKIFVIDDLADRKHNCEILLDQNFCLDKNIRYKNLVPYFCKSYTGPQYSLIKEDFWLEKKSNLLNNSIFVFFGGIDLAGATLKTLKTLINIGFENKVNIVCGSKNIKLHEIKELCKINNNFYLFIDTNEMAAIISSCSLGIGAGGVNMWERCILGLPTLVYSIAQNQEKISQDCDAANLCIYKGIFDNFTQGHIEELIKNTIRNQLIFDTCLREFKTSKIYNLIENLEIDLNLID